MIPEQNDAESFRKHTENMKSFRDSHQRIFGVLDKIQFPGKPGNRGKDIEFIKARGKPIIVPMWQIEPVKNSHN